MPKVRGQLTDFGFDPLTGNKPRIFFQHKTPGVSQSNILTTKPVEAVPTAGGFFELELAASAAVAPAGFYEITIRWTDASGNTWTEVLPWRLHVPSEGGSLADMLRVPQNPALTWTGAEPPRDPSPGMWWQKLNGEIWEFAGTGWNFKNSIQGPAGYNATGAAEDDAAIARFIKAEAGATAVREALEAYFTRKGALIVNVKDYGAKGDDKTDDTDAIHAACAAADVVFFPRGIYRTRGVKVPSRTALVGSWTREYGTPYPEHGARIRPLTAAQTGSIISLEGSGSKLEGLTVAGAGKASAEHNGITMGNQGIVTQCTVYGCVQGIDGRYRNGNIITQNQIHDNKGSGIATVLDTIVTHNTINANGWHGISLPDGANDNNIGFNKIEWNQGRGISVDGANACNIVSNIVDRNGLAGITVINTYSGSCGPNIVRRNGRLAEGTPDEDTNLRSSNNRTYVWLGNQTSTGGDDGGGGYVSPKSAMRTTGGTDVAFVANNFRGGTVTTVNTVTAGTRSVFVGNLGYKGPQEAMGTAANGSLAAGASFAETFDAAQVGTFNMGRVYQVTINARTAAGSKYAATLTVHIAREAGAALVSGVRVDQITGTAGTVGTEGTALAVTVNPTEDAGQLTISVLNKTSSTMQVRMGVTPL